ncbi:hypothetical protein [Desulfosporosinus metallidurans]|uniref:Uncharacterized protein n=1 Tax=Desulfosporosinus metallidurans TaxID=1888891 RepID=A0A1Q8QXI4_9FIRM|nr:hypothetical protein [Desulfosporosinus metallidurans]OLN32048.1 hypothetical protein DSOL_2141 [Desulfosporosinus metallidurans]
MKKIVSAILLSAILLTGNIAFAQGSTLANAKSKITQATADYRAKLAEIAPLQEKVRTNRTELLRLKKEANDAYNKAKSHIKGLLKNKDNLTPAQIKSLKESLDIIIQDKQSLAGTIGGIQKETLDLRTAKMEKNFDGVKNSLNSIIAVQNTRLEDLQRIISDINKAATL